VEVLEAKREDTDISKSSTIRALTVIRSTSKTSAQDWMESWETFLVEAPVVLEAKREDTDTSRNSMIRRIRSITVIRTTFKSFVIIEK
jgi:hypothetical protein